MNQVSNTKPDAIIFLNPDWVFYNTRPPTGLYVPFYDRVYKQSEELFGKRVIPGQEIKYFSSLEWETAKSYLFENRRLEKLNQLIEKVSQTANIRLVITGECATVGSTQVLRDQVLAHTGLSEYIFDLNMSTFVVISDIDHSFGRATSQKFPDNFVHVDHSKLLTKADVKKAEDILTHTQVNIPCRQINLKSFYALPVRSKRV